MTTKLQQISNLMEQTTKRIMEDPQEWAGFLQTAARLYKYSFEEQILIYAQRPNATACAPIDFWNKRMRRWVNRGTKGIALMDNSYTALRYVFDVSDTHSLEHAPLRLWKLEEAYQEQVIEELADQFGDADETTTVFDSQLKDIIRNAVQDNMSDYLSELLTKKDGSYLADLDDLNTEVIFSKALANSVSYMVLCRLGLDTEASPEDLSKDTLNFNTFDTLMQLGGAASDISEMLLRQIERTVISIKRQEHAKLDEALPIKDNNNKGEDERSVEHGDHVHKTGGLLDTRPDIGRTGDTAHRQIRNDEKDVSSEPQKRNIRGSGAVGEAEQPLGGYRGNGQRTGAFDSDKDGERARRHGETESRRSDEMGGHDEHDQAPSGGDSHEGDHLQLTLFPTTEDQIETINQAEAVKTSAFSISQQIIDEVLTSGGNEENSTHRIAFYFKKDHTLVDNAAFLKQEYGSGGKGLIFDGNHVAFWFNENGIHIAVGETALNASDATLITWEQTAKRIRELLDMGRYMSQSELDKADDIVIEELSSKLYFIYRDGVGKLPQEWTSDGSLYSDVLPVIAEQLRNPESLKLIKNKLDSDLQAIRLDETSDNFRWVNYFQRRGSEALRDLENLQRESLVFTADESVSAARPGFITQDEVDRVLCGGSNIQDSKFRIYSYFLQEHTAKEKADFLKHEYGMGGSGRKGFNESHDSKGIAYSRENNSMPYDKVILSWSKVANRIDELMADGKYMSQRELDYIPEYEKGILAREIRGFFMNLPQETPRPYPDGLDFSSAVEMIEPQLGDPARVDEIYQMMLPVWETVAHDDRHYEYRKRAFENMTAYCNGTFSLFGEKKELSASERDTETLSPAQAESSPVYDLKLGASAFIGADEYEIYAYDDAKVVLRDVSAPLFIRELPRDELDRRLRENPLNDGLIVKDNAPEAAEQSEPDIRYELGFGMKGNGTTVWNRLHEVHGDYETIAHISDDGVIKYYRDDLPADVVQKIENQADGHVRAAESITQAESEKPSEVKLRSIVLDFAHPRIEKRDYRITNDELGHGGAKTKYGYNVAAIRTVQTIEAESRMATAEEQDVLSRYVGWGGIPQAFDAENASWANEYAELKQLLSEDEYNSARESTLNAHYTSPTVIKAMYQAIEKMGFKTGNVLEPACGIGNFFGLVPESMKDCKLYGVELDGITGRIAKQLYQTANIAVQGYEETNLPDSFFDLAIGNVPFGSYGIADKRYDKNHFLIHDYFFAKTLDKVRPGGIVAFITSKGTMDKRNPAVRKYIAQRADLIGAIRLPNNAFTANAGTQVTSDIIFLQKRDRPIETDPDWVHLSQTKDGIPVNSYFAENPDMVLGTMTHEDRMYGNQSDTTCVPFEGVDLADQLQIAMKNIRAELTDYERDELEDAEAESIPADPNVRNFSYALVDGQVYFRENSRMNKIEVSVTAANRIRGMVELRDCTRKLIDYQLEGYPNEAIEREQQRLNTLYDNYTAKYGLINSRANDMAFSEDSSYSLLCSLEVIDENGELERKADMFTKRTIKPHVVVTSVDTASEALAVSLAEKACVDLPYMASLTGLSEEQVEADLQGVIFRDFSTIEPEQVPKALFQAERFPLVTADEYLTGNVRQKLKKVNDLVKILPAEQAAKLQPNIAALESVQPKDLTAGEIDVRLGATWLPKDDIQQFVFEFLKPSYHAESRIKVHYSPYTASWNVEGKSADYDGVLANVTYGTKRINAYQIIEQTLNLKDVRIFDKKVDDEGRETRVLNRKETTIAQQKQQQIKDAFCEWIWKNHSRRERLVQLYNEKFNSIRPREYDGSHLKFYGINPEITLRPHQVNAIARILHGGNTLLGHVVGAGKTYEMTAAAMESKRLGLCSKSLFVVPNHLTEQWAAEFLQLYPSANILVATRKDFEKRNRRKFCGRIATGDYDAVIIGHSQFEKIPMSIERQKAILQEQLDEIVFGIKEAKDANAERFTIKQMEKTKKSIKLKLDKLNDTSRKDDVVTFEELGVDRLFVDEAHNYKNLFLVTKMRNVAGLAQTEAQKSSDLFTKCRYLDELTGGRGVVFATGTPISNSMTELYTMQRYLQYETLRDQGLQHFDAWASTFGETVTAIELAPEGTGYRAKTRFARFYNLPELISMFKMVADIQTADMLNLPVPEAEHHNVVIKPSEHQRDMVAELAERAEKVRNGMVEATEDNMLKITNDGRKLALDQRLISELLPDDPDSKVSVCVDNVYRIWKQNKEKKLTQLVFSDLSTPHYDGSFNVYDDTKNKLIDMGVPEDEIAFIHDANTEIRKKELFANVRKGNVRILLGSTFKMGAGTNVQKRLVAEHHLDVPWRPSDIEQREGRIIRQGNENEKVHVLRYVTENTFDSYMWQTIENKQKFISQIMTSKSPVRSCEDIDETALSYAEVKALATGNPYIKEKMDLDIQVARLKLLKANHLSQRYAMEDNLHKYFPAQIRQTEERIRGYEQDIARLDEFPMGDGQKFSPMTIGMIMYTEKEHAGQALLDACKAKTSPEPSKIGEYRGFTLVLSFDTFSKEFHLTLKNVLSHSFKLGADVFGNISRIDNALSGMPEKLESCKRSLVDLQRQVEEAKMEVDKPFAQEQELTEKAARLVELDALLNMEKEAPDVVEGEVEQEVEQEDNTVESDEPDASPDIEEAPDQPEESEDEIEQEDSMTREQQSAEWQEKIERARSVSIVEVVESAGYQLSGMGKVLSTKEYYGIKVYPDTNSYCNWSHDKRGGTPIDFLINECGMEKKEAIERLAEEGGYIGPKIEHGEQRPKGQNKTQYEASFLMPKKAENNKRVYAYLSSRGIKGDLIHDFIHKGLLYESDGKHNCVFVGLDEKGVQKAGYMRGTNTYAATPFKGNVPFSNKEYGVFYEGAEGADCLSCFEAPIDMMSFMQLRDTPSHKVAMCSLDDTSIPRVLERYPGIKKLCFCLDNDEYGREAAAGLKEKYEQMGYEVYEVFPPDGKDWNEWLKIKQSMEIPKEAERQTVKDDMQR